MEEEKNIKKTNVRYQNTAFSALSARERYDFARFLAKYGANFRTSLDRIMYRGFDEWECEEVREIMQNWGCSGCTPQHFFVEIGREGRAELYRQLANMGMCRNTANRRFSTGSFKKMGDDRNR